MSRQPEVDEAGRRLCSSQECDNPATHWYIWTNEPTMQCANCVQAMMGVAQVMGHLAPVATVRPMIFAEMYPQIALQAQREEALDRLDDLTSVYRADNSEKNWDNIVQSSKYLAGLVPDWVVRTPATS